MASSLFLCNFDVKYQVSRTRSRAVRGISRAKSGNTRARLALSDITTRSSTIMSAATNGQKDGSAVASESHGGGSSATTDKSAPAAGGSSTTSQAAGSNGKDAAAGNDSSKAAQPSPLDGLSPGELRQKLEQTRKELRGYLDKKRKIDQELVSLFDCVMFGTQARLTLLRFRVRWKRQFTRSKGPTSRTRYYQHPTIRQADLNLATSSKAVGQSCAERMRKCQSRASLWNPLTCTLARRLVSESTSSGSRSKTWAWR